MTTIALTPGAAPSLPVDVLGTGALDPSTLVALRRLGREADVLVAHGSKALPASVLATAGLRRPIVYLSIGDPYHWSRQLHRRVRTAALLWRTARVVSLTDEGARRVSERYWVDPSKVRVIPNGVLPSAFPLRDERTRHEARRGLGVTDGDRVLAYVGALSPEKGPLDAVATLAHLPDNWRLIMAGEGSERARIEASDAFAAGRISLLGQVDSPRGLMTAADVLVLPSRTEGRAGSPHRGGARRPARRRDRRRVRR